MNQLRLFNDKMWKPSISQTSFGAPFPSQLNQMTASLHHYNGGRVSDDSFSWTYPTFDKRVICVDCGCLLDEPISPSPLYLTPYGPSCDNAQDLPHFRRPNIPRLTLCSSCLPSAESRSQSQRFNSKLAILGIQSRPLFPIGEKLERKLLFRQGRSGSNSSIVFDGNRDVKLLSHQYEDYDPKPVDENNNLPYVCHICYKTFNRSDNLKSHVLGGHGAPKFECHVCFSAYRYAHDLKKHVAIKHGREPENEEKLVQDRQMEMATDHNETDSMFGFNKLRDPRSVHLGIRNLENGNHENWNDTDALKPLRSDGSNAENGFENFSKSSDAVSCFDEGKDATNGGAAAAPASHLTQPVHQCRFCPRVYRQRQSLKNHVDVVHLKKGFDCDTCGKLFPRRDQLREHVQEVHLFMSFGCCLCPSSFRRQRHLRSHYQAVHGTTAKQAELDTVGVSDCNNNRAIINHDITKQKLG